MPTDPPRQCPPLMTSLEVACYLRWRAKNKAVILKRLKKLRDSGLLVGALQGQEWMYRTADVIEYVKEL